MPTFVWMAPVLYVVELGWCSWAGLGAHGWLLSGNAPVWLGRGG